MKPPKVSVLMAVHNAESFLSQAIESILSQSFEDFELLIHDDGSKDKSVEIIQSFRDSRIRAVLHPVNQGEARVRNQCLQRARGKYVAILDADDIAQRERLRIQTDFLERNGRIVLLGSRYEIIDEVGGLSGIQKMFFEDLPIKWGLLFGNQFGHSTVMYRRTDVLAVGGYDETLAWAIDFDLWVRLTTRGRFANLLHPLVQYRVHSRNITHSLQSSVKESANLRVVAKSIQKLTGQTVDLDVARVLTRDIYKPARTKAILEQAYSTIYRCLGLFVNSSTLNRRERHMLVTLAVRDLFRLAEKNPGSVGLARTKALRSIARYDTSGLIKKRSIGILAEKLLPSGIIRAARRITGLSRHARHVFSFE